jgi:hypothetical protein
MAPAPNRLVLEGVPRVGFYQGGPGCPEDIPFPSVMRALMEYFKEADLDCHAIHPLQPGCNVNCSYSFFIGVSGVASSLSWKTGWDADAAEVMPMADDRAAPFERAFQAAGYEHQLMGVAKDREDEAFSRQRIIGSIQAGRPVLAFGPIGPPEAAILTGYDAGGDVLIGWSFFQHIAEFNAGVEFEPSGQFRKRDWFNYPPGFSFIVIGQREQRPPLGETYRRALDWMLQMARTRVTPGGRHNGLAAYTTWAEHLLGDEDFPEDEAILLQRHDVHHGAVGMLAESRWYGSQFLIQASNPDVLHYSMTEDLLHAAACYAAEHELMWQLWDLAGGNGNPEAYRYLADPVVRRQMVPVIQQARERDAQATEHITRALAKR